MKLIEEYQPGVSEGERTTKKRDIGSTELSVS